MSRPIALLAGLLLALSAAAASAQVSADDAFPVPSSNRFT